MAVPENASANVEGLGDKFEVKETKVEGQKVTVTFALKGGDIVTGAATVILAMGAGKVAAASITKHLG